MALVGWSGYREAESLGHPNLLSKSARALSKYARAEQICSGFEQTCSSIEQIRSSFRESAK